MFPHVLSLFLTDLRKKASWCYQDDSRRALVKTLFTDGTMAMLLYRLMQQSRRWRLAPLTMFFNKLNAVCCGCIIGRGADFGPGFVLVHSLGVVVNSKVRGGANVVIEHQVTIGDRDYKSPVLGNDVFVGAGAKILGDVRIGDGARIGANAVVLNDVPAQSTAVGVPARIVSKNEALPGEMDQGRQRNVPGGTATSRLQSDLTGSLKAS